MVILVMGVSGSGKTTVGRKLAEAIGGQFVDADDVHPAANVEKMRRGEPLTGRDRGPWLRTLRAMVDGWLDGGRTVVLACSALTRHSRAVLGAGRPGIRVVFLDGPRDLLEARMRRRRHFMPPSLLHSQLATLERPARAIVLDVREPPVRLVRRIVERIGEA